MLKNAPVVLLILDGWGYRETVKDNAISEANTPQWDEWWQTRPHTLLTASGKAVGLPDQQMGNSEVGHMHIGAGRIILQDFTRINEAIVSGKYAKNPVFLQIINTLKKSHKTLHVMGLLSSGGVHSHEDHLFAFLEICAAQHFDKIFLHLFLDGRDTAPKSALASIKKLHACLDKYPVATIASICGRYFSMDRDTRWERTEAIYRLLTENQTIHKFKTPEEAITYFYDQHIYDEFIPPTKIGDSPVVANGDAMFFFNFRADRAKQLTEAFLLENFEGFARKHQPQLAAFLSMTSYSNHLPTTTIFPKVLLKNTLGEVLAQHHLRQLRIAETEKYAHVTFFLNGGSEHLEHGEERVLIPSPPVATYDQQPEMSALAITKTIQQAISEQRYEVIICNFANADMVGHTGDFNATVKAIETLDKSMHAIWNSLEKVGGSLLITADHGNAELMFNDITNQPHTAHTNYLVPFVYVGQDATLQCRASNGSLIDIAPTLLKLLNIAPPTDMQGSSLLVDKHATSN